MLFNRMFRAARFDTTVYEELRRDPVALAQAITIMVLVLGALVTGTTLFVVLTAQSSNILALALLDPLTLWILPAMSLFLLGGLARVNDPDRGSDRDLLLTMGFSASPGLLWVIPHPIFAVVIWGWVMAAMVLGARAMLKISFVRSIIYIAPGLLTYWLLFSLLSWLLGRG